MLKLVIPSSELYDETKGFITMKEQHLQLEHSLVSFSKWESKWLKPFLTKDNKTREETVDYIKCMTLTQNVDPEVYTRITDLNIEEVGAYIDAPMTATILPKEKETLNRETVTAEIIYYWMITLTIPFECQKWHLNKLITLINVCNLKNKPHKKMSRNEIIARNRDLNKQRREAANSKG